MDQSLLQSFIEFGLAGLIGFALGLERAMAGSENPHAGTRDFIMFALLGAVSAYLGEILGNYWPILAGFLGSLTLLLLGYWIDRDRDSGITTEIAAILTFFLGVLIVIDAKDNLHHTPDIAGTATFFLFNSPFWQRSILYQDRWSAESSD